jgi:hypothetical protein
MVSVVEKACIVTKLEKATISERISFEIISYHLHLIATLHVWAPSTKSKCTEWLGARMLISLLV